MAVAEARPPSDEYETDSEDDFFLIGRTKTLRLLQFLDPGGQYAPSFRLDLYGTCTLTVDIFQKLFGK